MTRKKNEIEEKYYACVYDTYNDWKIQNMHGHMIEKKRKEKKSKIYINILSLNFLNFIYVFTI